MTDKNIEVPVGDLIHSVTLLGRRVRAAAGAHELSLGELAVLSRLREGPATTADLARAEDMKPQSMGATVAALEEEGLVGRRPHPTDGRQMLIEVTPTGTELLESRRAAKLGWLAQAIAQLSLEEQALLVRASAIIKRLAEQ